METEEVLEARRLGIIGIDSVPIDVETPQYTCSYDLEDATNDCHVVYGQMSIIARKTDDLNLSIAVLRQAINATMTNDELLGPDLPTVVKVTYIGEYPPTAIAKAQSDEGEGEDRTAFRAIISASFIWAALLLLLLFFWKKKRPLAVKSERDVPPVAAVGAAEDPVGSFHHGRYHYTRDGERYLSNSCAECQQTLMDLRQDRGLAPIDEGAELDGECMLVTADSKDLGGRHLGIDVHQCTSATCKECMMARHGVSFMPVGARPPDEDSTSL